MTDAKTPDPMRERLADLRERALAGPFATPSVPIEEMAAIPAIDRRAEFLDWWLAAARLAMLGEDAPFRRWPEHASRLDVDATQAVREAASAGIETLGTGAGEPLGEAMVDVDDAAGLLRAEVTLTGLLEAALAPLIEAWILAATQAVLDEEAWTIVIEHRDAWPVPDDVRPACVRRPLTGTEMAAVAVSRPPTPPLRTAAPAARVLEEALFDGGRPTEGMRRRFEGRAGEAVVSSGARLDVKPRLDAYWGVLIELSGAAARGIRSVRLGTFPLRELDVEEGPGSETTRYFELLLAGQPLELRLQLLASDIGVTTGDGGRFLL